MKINWKSFIAPAVTAIVAGVLAVTLDDGCGGGAPAPTVLPATRVVVTRDSLDIDSLRATIEPEIQYVVRTRLVPVTGDASVDTSAIDSADAARQLRLREAALLEAQQYISELQERIAASATLRDIVAYCDTTISDPSKESIYDLRLRFRYYDQSFGVQLQHQFMAHEPSIWAWMESSGPWIVGALGALKLILDLTGVVR